MGVLLEARGLKRYFGGVRALDGLDVTVNEGEIVGIIGPNGAGKSTLFNVITNVFPPTAGQVFYNGEEITGIPPHEVARKGLMRTFQRNLLYPPFSVLDNVRMALHLKSGYNFFEALFNTPSYRRKEELVDKQALATLGSADILALKDRISSFCSFGAQRRLGISVGVATQPKMVLMDEPMAALNPEQVSNITKFVRQIRDAGTTIAIVEHNMRPIFALCDRVVVLAQGRKLAEGTPAEIRDNELVIQTYLGRHGSAAAH
ncbi:MAG: ABC transporter ATP-binding protein [SAR202 cluster bacterium]|nr:ABC transporter ATP-binding protein [SAR202 cluster bacterium]